jgi:hypothetical protein
MPVSREPVEFTINVRGEVTGEQFIGKFRTKPRLSHRDILRRDQIFRELLGGPGVEKAAVAAFNTADVFSQLWTRLTQTPDWWKQAGQGLDLDDLDPVQAVYNEVMRIERENIEALRKEAEADREELRKDPVRTT